MFYLCTFTTYFILYLHLYYKGWKLFRAKSTSENSTPLNEKLSIVIPIYNPTENLEQLITEIIDQHYPAGFEIIVVLYKTNDNAIDILKRYEATYRNIRHTCIPDTAHFVDFQKLAITIGIKAVRTKWFTVIAANTQLNSRMWLKSLSENISPDCDLIIGYYNYQVSHQSIPALQYETHIKQLKDIYRISRGKKPNHLGHNWIMRKSALDLKQLYQATHISITLGANNLLLKHISSDKIKSATQPDSQITILSGQDSITAVQNEIIAEQLFLNRSQLWQPLQRQYTGLLILTLYLCIIAQLIPIIAVYPTLQQRNLSAEISEQLLFLIPDLSPTYTLALSAAAIAIMIGCLYFPVKAIKRHFAQFKVNFTIPQLLFLPIAVPIFHFFRIPRIIFQKKNYRRRL